MGLLWDIFKGNISVGEIHICFGELEKIWNVFTDCIEEETEIKGISLRKLKLKDKDIERCSSSELWELCISYYRDEYDCIYKATYNLGSSIYSVLDGEDLSEECRKKLKGYLFNAIKSIYLLNSRITDVVVKQRNVSNTVMLVSTVDGRSIILYEGDCSKTKEIKTVTRKNITEVDSSFYNNIVSL